jgi:RNA polymerase sigma-70 factor (ECF subfamily)
MNPLAVEQELVGAASAGDQEAFRRLFDEHRRAIHVHCYRMLGSLHDAEDATQETFLRGWRRLGTFEGRSTLRSWLYGIATNACLDMLERRSKRVLPHDVTPAADPHADVQPPATEIPWLEPYPDVLLEDADPSVVVFARETIELAFLAAIQHLSPKQRAVLILRDVLHWSASEVAELLDTSAAAVNSALQRARATLSRRAPASHLDAAASRASDEDEQRLLQRYVRAWEHADVAALVALLKEDATMTMPPVPSWYAGREAIGAFFATHVFGPAGVGETRLVVTRANRAPALAVYHWNEEEDVFRPLGIKIFAIAEGAIATISGFSDTSLFPLFQLPPALSGRETYT